MNQTVQETRTVDQFPMVTRQGLLDCQVCVPADWTDKQVEQFANENYPCGTTHGWQIRTREELLAGCPVRNPCSDRGGFVHVTLDA